MDLALRRALREAIESNPDAPQIVRSISMDESGQGTIEYEPAGLSIDASAPGFKGTTAKIGDEELVRAYLLTSLVSEFGYSATPGVLSIERVYKAVGRPGKGGRIDVLVERPAKGEEPGEAFLFIECKAPSEYDHDLKYVDGQLFRLSLQEVPRPRYLVYFTVELKEGQLRNRSIIVDTRTYGDYEAWDAAGQPIIDVLPTRYGEPVKRRYGNVEAPTTALQPLDRAATPEVFNRLQAELHDVIWGGGGTNNNEVFVYITKLILVKIYDEHLTAPGAEYQFQRLGDPEETESPAALTERMNKLYKEAEVSYLALPSVTEGPAFDSSRISPEKLAFVIGRLEGLSITENVHPGDLLGEFFEQIVSQDFTQTKGQFFTPMKIVRFMLELADAVPAAEKSMLTKLDSNGRPLLPTVIDPSCGVGSFLIEYMRQVRERLAPDQVRDQLAPRLRDYHDQWFGGSGNRWAQSFLFGVENNYDLGLAAKVNMVLHGDGSMNTWIASGLAPFNTYWLEGRNNILGSAQPADGADPVYAGPRNEQFDLVISNPPFSIKLPDDEKAATEETFSELPVRVSEALFVERWYQLLRPGGRFCCIVPESILDTAENKVIRLFLLSRFRIRAIVSLPYVAFRPFTSTKTSIVLAEKRPPEETREWQEEIERLEDESPTLDEDERVAQALERLGWADEAIFMAEPASVGYKRRRNLPDLPRPNDLTDEAGGGGSSVIGAWRDAESAADAVFGFRTPLRAVASRSGLRLDPKYRWLWDVQEGVALGDGSEAIPLGKVLEIVALRKVKKGQLDEATEVIDLEQVESREALTVEEIPTLEEIGSERVSFEGAELAFSRLEPYLGKIILSPPEKAIGTPEWIGLRRTGETPLLLIAYLLLLPEMREAYRRLQGGKRHARLAPKELLDLLVTIPEDPAATEIASTLAEKRAQILDYRRTERKVRISMDAAFEEVRLRLGSSDGGSA